MRRIGVDARRARLGLRHGLAAPVSDVVDASAALVGLHSSDPVSVYLAARARVDGFEREDLEGALYEDRSLARMLGMRRTLFVVPRDIAGEMAVACARDLADRERRRLVRMLEEQAIAEDGEGWVSAVAAGTLAALRDRGEATAVELTRDVPELAEKIYFGEGKRWGGAIGVSTRILFLLATEGSIVRGRPRGTWLSSQYRWAPTDQWFGEPLPNPEPGDAAAGLLRRWLRSFGPGTLTDIRWWTGWTAGKARAALAATAAVEVELDGGTGYVLPDDVEPAPVPPDWVALLPGLDPTVMGWKERDWYLGDHAAKLFDRNGNAGPTVWWNGRVVGGWAQRPDGEVVVAMLEAVPKPVERRIEAEVRNLKEWLGESRVTPRFRAPMEKELASS